MKTSKLLAAAVLAAAVGAPIAGLIGDLKGQPMTSNGLQAPFLHSLPIGPTASQSELASLERRTSIGGKDLSPQLAWSGFPADARSE